MENKPYSLKKAAIINAAGKYSKILLQIIVEVILARLLTPYDYGIVAVVTVFTTFFTTLADMGLGAAIIQVKSLTKKDIDDIYSFTVYLSVALMSVFALLAYWIASFYHNHVYVGIGQLLSIALLFNGLNMVPNGILNREKKFGTIAVRTVAVYVISVVITIGLAYYGWKYYALVAQAILVAVLTFVWNFITTKPRFSLRFSFAPLKRVASYSGYQFAFSLLNYFSRNLDNLLAGKFFGSTDLGYYNKSYNLMQYPVGNLTGILTPVLHPVLSDYQHQVDLMYKKYMRVVKLLATVGIYAQTVCIFAAPEIIGILYGKQWQNSVVVFQLLGISIATQIINSSNGGLFQALGNTRMLFITGCINTVTTVLSIIGGIFIGKTIYSLALWISISYILNFVVSFYFLIKLGFKKSILEFLKELFPYICLGILMEFATIFYPFHISGLFLSLIVKGIYISILFIFGVIITGQFKFLKSLIKR
ncbi:lipopolysaccharide biosynthesis protein [Lactobacillus rodentium]|uniref:Colanic acid exporter n=1 Tax=Lactobacillus rodentium TaxID=947835 RepID=A0A2Z6TDJ4_9LACO|nr:lipopolysaccharide biosynthesis protein [Lactobacillus rodentium]MCR1894754.1 lipopolysaccharide biosynthesis protein [Lactobacillus rodentium]GBG04995.1 colanic acid exporter [Lactobacillus rodentium]